MANGVRKGNLSFKTYNCLKETLRYAAKKLGMNLSNVCEALVGCLISFVEGNVDKEKQRFLRDFWSAVSNPPDECNNEKKNTVVSIRIRPESKEKLMRLIDKMMNMKMCETKSSCLHEIFSRSLSRKEFMELVSVLSVYAYESNVDGDEGWDQIGVSYE